MKTLYDLLGALPDDDADSLRTAFRNAVKANHPDIATDDPDAALRFRQIVRANAILSDTEQRATYDRLLALTLRRPDPTPKRSGSGTILRKLASDAMKVAFLSTVSIGGYLVFRAAFEGVCHSGKSDPGCCARNGRNRRCHTDGAIRYSRPG